MVIAETMKAHHLSHAELLRAVLEAFKFNLLIPGNWYQMAEPEVQRIAIEATKTNARIDSLNRGGGRIKLVDAQSYLEQAIQTAERLGIKLAQN